MKNSRSRWNFCAEIPWLSLLLSARVFGSAFQ